MKSIKYLFPVLILSLSSCEIGLNSCINGDGNKIERELELPGEVRIIQFKLSGDLELRQGERQEVIIEGDQNIVDLIERESVFRNNTWFIDDGEDCIDTDGLKIFVQLRSLEGVALLGSGDIKSDNILTVEDDFFTELDGSGKIDLKIAENRKILAKMQGSGDLKIEGSTDEMIAELDGSGKIDIVANANTKTYLSLTGSGEIKVDGETDELRIELVGSGDIKADDYRSQDCRIQLDGSGDIEVFAENTLDVDIKGSGDVCYKGDPTVTVNIDGSGDVRPCN